MDSNDGINSKDVLFSVWYNDTYIPLYDNVHRGKYIFKINNLDIWVSDAGSRAVVGRSRNVLHFNRDYFAFQQFVSVKWTYYKQLHSDYVGGLQKWKDMYPHRGCGLSESYYMFVKILLKACNLP